MQQPIGAGVEKQPELVGFPSVARGAVGFGIDRHSYDAEKRHALDLWGSYVERVAAGMPAPSNVVELAQTGR